MKRNHQQLQDSRSVSHAWRHHVLALGYALFGIFNIFSLPAVALEPEKVLFVGDNRSFTGSYVVSDKSISVEIDGLAYRGFFGDKLSDAGQQAKLNTDAVSTGGNWGRAFLFASSAKTIQCALDTAFPNVSGRCHDADGNVFKLVPGSRPSFMDSFPKNAN